MTSLSLRARITATLLVVLVAVMLVVATAAATFMTVRQDQERVIDTYYEAVTTSNEQFIGLLDAETAIRGYALTGDPAQLAPMAATAGDEGWSQQVDRRLRSLLVDDPQALALLTATQTSASAWWQQWAQPMVEQVRSGGPGSVSAADVEQGTRLFEAIRGDYSAYVDRLDDRRHDAADALRNSTARLFAAVIAIGVVALLALAAVAWLLRRWVTGPLTRLADETHVVRDGDLRHAVHVDGPPELARLADDVEAMRQTLVDRIEAARSATSDLRAAHASLEEQTAELERSNRDLEQFAYAASHDLQEPLRKVASFTQMLQRRYSGQLDERADQYIEFAVDGAKRMQQLINDLLEFSRVGRLTSAHVEVDLDACLDRALRDLDTAIETSGAVVTRDALPVVRGEALLLTQLLVNLVGNAIKFRSQETPRVHVGARREGDVWSLWVRDNGIGIEPRYAERVFVIFQRLHPKEMYGGTGIGLALCQKIIEYHGGSMWVDVDGPADRVGTTIRWSLPALDGAVHQDGHAVDSAFDLGGTDAD